MSYSENFFKRTSLSDKTFITCKRCGEKDLRWSVAQNGYYFLVHAENRTPHKCGKDPEDRLKNIKDVICKKCKTPGKFLYWSNFSGKNGKALRLECENRHYLRFVPMTEKFINQINLPVDSDKQPEPQKPLFE